MELLRTPSTLVGGNGHVVYSSSVLPGICLGGTSSGLSPVFDHQSLMDDGPRAFALSLELGTAPNPSRMRWNMMPVAAAVPKNARNPLLLDEPDEREVVMGCGIGDEASRGNSWYDIIYNGRYSQALAL